MMLMDYIMMMNFRSLNTKLNPHLTPVYYIVIHENRFE